jgi:hypothetical protein
VRMSPMLLCPIALQTLAGRSTSIKYGLLRIVALRAL